jgi:hypothetical protein
LAATAALCLLLALIPPAIAFAAIVSYANGTNGVNGTFQSSGRANRTFNRVYHANGYEWSLYYCNSTCSTHIYGYANPTVDGRNWSNAWSLCRNIADNSNVHWTCQTDN